MRFCVLISAGHSTSYGTNDASQPSNYTWTTMNAKQSEPKGSTPQEAIDLVCWELELLRYGRC
ncbi:MAG: hypothetical protein QOK33_4489 [Mycobacterium sp.]|jgi:hypothetical protein|nr:hypothetical protein [Mycobacterium sp.]MDT5401258.1 hypothetical protein [Mycobacterium sp.]